MQTHIPDNYANIFERRGQQHAEAFRKFPNAVAEECASLLSLAGIKPGESVLDVPSASGFLSRYVKLPGIRLSAVDPSPVLHALCKEVVADSYCAPMDALPFEANSFDLVLCLAGLHHEPKLLESFLEVRRVLSRGGRFAIAEVEENTGPAAFLNGFVHENSSIGHEGSFFNQRYREALSLAGFDIVLDRLASYHWRFASVEDMTTCLALMFGIDRASPESIEAAIRSTLGVDFHPDGFVDMRWCLRQVLCVPSQPNETKVG